MNDKDILEEQQSIGQSSALHASIWVTISVRYEDRHGRSSSSTITTCPQLAVKCDCFVDASCSKALSSLVLSGTF